MRNLFQSDNPIMRMLSTTFDLILLNANFLISCIPIFTIGAAISALYNTAIKLVRKEDVYIMNNYWKAFRSSFKQGTVLGLVLVFLCIFFTADLYIIYVILDPSLEFLQFPVWLLIFIVISIMIYAFPLLSLYQNTMKQTIKNAILISISNMPVTIFIVFLHVALLYFSSLSGDNLVFIGSLGLFFGFAFMSYFCSLFINRILERCEQLQNPDQEPSSDLDLAAKEREEA